MRIILLMTSTTLLVFAHPAGATKFELVKVGTQYYVDWSDTASELITVVQLGAAKREAQIRRTDGTLRWVPTESLSSLQPQDLVDLEVDTVDPHIWALSGLEEKKRRQVPRRFVYSNRCSKTVHLVIRYLEANSGEPKMSGIWQLLPDTRSTLKSGEGDLETYSPFWYHYAWTESEPGLMWRGDYLARYKSEPIAMRKLESDSDQVNEVVFSCR